MKAEEINRAIAEACEWHRCPTCLMWAPPLIATEDTECSAFLPNYCGDLNAMHEAEAALPREQQFEYHNHLFDILPCDENHGCSGAEGDTLDIMTPSGFTMLRATAAKRAEAFLRTIGKWKDTTP